VVRREIHVQAMRGTYCGLTALDEQGRNAVNAREIRKRKKMSLRVAIPIMK
jgi:hypothetical protein